jgi:S1-C subfamily serine protease
MKLSVKQFALYLFLVAIGSSIGVFASQFLLPQNHSFQALKNVTLGSTPESITPNSVDKLTNSLAKDNVNFIVTAVQKVGPAVVRINSTRKVANSLPDVLKNSWLHGFFGDNQQSLPPEKIERGTGSGFLISENGELLTNAHVVADTDTVQVTLTDGRTFPGKVVGLDTISDIAVVEISADNLPKVKLGNSQNLIPGEWAIAIGNPLGLDNTVTIGIISATDRTSAQVGVPDKRVSFIQTDAAINPGNSGGPLLNAQGEVIGINTAIRTDAQGLGFAIPIETAARIAHELYTKGRVDHPFLGIEVIDLNPGKKQLSPEIQRKIPVDVGVVIKGLVENSPARQSGLEAGDVIQKINHKPLKIAAQVQKMIDSGTVGDILEMEINRNRKIRTFKVRLGIYP